MELNLEKLIKLPMKSKVIILAAMLVIEVAALVWFLYLPKINELKGLNAEFTKLQSEISEKSHIAANLPKTQSEYEQLNLELAQALTELPNSKEIPSLLTNITTLGNNAGLDFLTFRPKGESPKDFYAEVPVDIVISGSYYSVANFFAAVSKLPRIVNISNVSFSDIRSTGNRMITKVTCLATTFRFLDKKEISDATKSAVKK